MCIHYKKTTLIAHSILTKENIDQIESNTITLNYQTKHLVKAGTLERKSHNTCIIKNK